MRGSVLLTLAAPVVCAVTATAAWLAPRHTGEHPPECVNLRIVENSGNGPTLYLRACGTGSRGESPVLDQVSSLGPLVVDGGPLTPGACSSAARCVVLWPRSPVEGTGER